MDPRWLEEGVRTLLADPGAQARLRSARARRAEEFSERRSTRAIRQQVSEALRGRALV
jgi:hypothetical protein